MSENRYTPGPWVIFNTGTTNQIMPAMRSGMIADSINSIADAKLIAQAPNLLAACQMLVELMQDEEPDPEWREQVIASAQMTIRIVEDQT